MSTLVTLRLYDIDEGTGETIATIEVPEAIEREVREYLRNGDVGTEKVEVLRFADLAAVKTWWKS